MMVLAQAAGNELTGFMEQPFVGPVLGMTCVLAILLVAVVATLIYVRRRKNAQFASSMPMPPSFVTSESLGHDMPDLDDLVSTTGFMQPAPVAAPPARAVRKGTFLVAVNDGDATEAVEIMTIMRDVMDGHLIVQMGDKAYQSVNNDTEFKERFNKVMRELAQVIGKPVSQPPALGAAPQPNTTEVEEEDEPQAPTPSLADLMQPEEPAPAPPKPRPTAPPPPPPAGRMPGDLPSFKLDDNPYERPKRGQKADIKPVPELNIAGAIEAYLQYKLSHTPDYQGRSIHIYPSPDGGVSIEVDGHFFDAVGDIPDTDTREFIAGAIQEWQERH
ncbi:MAG: hypothetical protein ABI690_28870 [Chloroflexota bacterium]